MCFLSVSDVIHYSYIGIEYSCCDIYILRSDASDYEEKRRILGPWWLGIELIGR